MNNELVKIFHESPGRVRLLPVGAVQDISLIPGILSAFEEQFRNHNLVFIIDLEQVKDFSPSLIVLLLELTARTRRRGGDVQLINVSDHGRNDFDTFDVLGYLSMEEQRSTPLPQTEPAMGAKSNDLVVESITIASRPDVVYKACDFVVMISRRMGFSETEVNKIKLSVYEACLNVVEHAYHSDPTKHFRVAVYQTVKQMEIQVIDQGDGFEATNGSFDVIAAAAARQTGGMGLHIIRRSMDTVSYQRNTPEGNKLIMIKRC